MVENLENWARTLVEAYGYVGIFLISLTESIVQPIPPDPFIAGGTALGLDPWFSAIIATLGSVFGGLVAHTLGNKLGEPVVRRLIGENSFTKGEKLFNRYGIYAVLIAAVTPIPFKAVCWLAGIFEMKRITFLIASFLGRFPRFMMVAFIGDSLGNLL